ncbi:MAG: lipoate--protein ligase family protein [Planctomycetaceae bacterium]|nr:lipoate--protein ligase family protein [Planctomycetaceae bacterium]
MIDCRLVREAPADGRWNMSVDQMLLEQAAAGKTTLRFYEWSEPTLSLGYFQSFQHRNEHQESLPCAWLRRASGGGAILHDLELTYSFATPQIGRAAKQQQHLYDAFHNSLIQALAAFDVLATRCGIPIPTGPPPFLCFQRQTIGDVLINDHKVMGSAQRKYQQGILQHGSILLQKSQYTPQLPGIHELSKAVQVGDLIDQWQPLLAAQLSLQLQPEPLSESACQRSLEIDRSKFGTQRWNQKR